MLTQPAQYPFASKLDTLRPQSDDRNGAPETTTFHIEPQQAPGESPANCLGSVRIVLHGGSAPAMQTMAAPQRSAPPRANYAVQGGGRRRTRAAPAAAQKPPVTSRPNYAGLKMLPSGAYGKIEVPTEGSETCQKHFQCKFRLPDGAICEATFQKSTSLIIHY